MEISEFWSVTSLSVPASTSAPTWSKLLSKNEKNDIQQTEFSLFCIPSNRFLLHSWRIWNDCFYSFFEMHWSFNFFSCFIRNCKNILILDKISGTYFFTLVLKSSFEIQPNRIFSKIFSRNFWFWFEMFDFMKFRYENRIKQMKEKRKKGRGK